MTSRALLTVLGLGTALAAGCQDRTPAVEPNVTAVRIAAGPGAGPNQLAYALQRSFESSNARVQLDITVKEGSRAAEIQAGEFDVGFAPADMVYVTFAQEEDRESPSRLRGIAVLQARLMHLVVMPRSAIEDVADLRNRTVGTGSAMSDNAFTARRVLGAARGFNAPEPRPSREAMSELVDGRLDALLVLSTVPFEPIAAAMRRGARLVPVQGEIIEELRRTAPILRPSTIPAGSYPGQSSRIRTVAVNELFICSSELDEEVVYLLTKQFFGVLSSIASEPYLRAIDWSQVDATPIPLHPGAARYYREQELLR